MSYVTGAHSIKVGYQAAHEVYRQTQNADNQLAYTFNNGTPTQLTMRIAPHNQSNRTRYGCRERRATSTRGAGSLRARTASPQTTSSAAASYSRGRTA
jgi:hypothetical protein